MKSLQTILLNAYHTLMLIVLGGTIFAVMVEYPNWFADIPRSIQATRDFYQVLHPGYFFQIFGPLMVLTGVAFVAVGWRERSTRNLVALSLLVMVAIEMLTFLYIYPRLNVMFVETGQSAEALRLAAEQFTFADRIRTAMMFVATAIGMTALFRFRRDALR